jgi:hypothetical protein
MLQQSATVLRTTSETRDAIGGVTPVTSSVVVDAYLEPLRGREDLTDRNTQIGTWLMVVGPDADIDGWDKVTYDGRTFEVTAPPEPHFNPRTKALHHYEVELQEVI